MNDERTDEEKARSKRVHALVMIILGAIMSVCALAAGLIALTPGVFPSWMTGGWSRREAAAYRTPKTILVPFAEFNQTALSRARVQHKLVLLHLSPVWSSEARIMEGSTYADPKTAAWIAEHLVATRADSETRPDLEALYGVGASLTTALIYPDGRPLAGAARLTPGLLIPWGDLILRTLKDDPAKAEGFAADARRRSQAVARRPEPALGAPDPIWGGVHHSPSEYAMTLADQTRVVLSTDSARAKQVLAFVERFMALPGGGYAASMSGEVVLDDGRIESGASYFSKDEAGRRAAGLPLIDRRVFPRPSADMARAVLLSKVATPAQKAQARRTVDFVRTRYKLRIR